MSQLISLIVLILLAHSVSSAVSNHHEFCSHRMAEHYAMDIAKIQFAKNKEMMMPFKIKNTTEVTKYYFAAANYSAKKIRDIAKNNPVEIVLVNLESLNKWECQYYVTLSTESSRKCDFVAIYYDFCSK